MVIGLCDRFHKLPSEIYAEDADLLRLLAIVRRGTPDTPDPDPMGGDDLYG